MLIAAAADLAPAQAILEQAATPCSVRFTFGSSGMLAQQIRHGADFDLFLSASEAYVTDLERQGVIVPKSNVRYALGRIGLWSTKKIRFEDILSVRTVAIANPQHAPYGRAAQQALEHRGMWEEIRPRLVFGENVRQALRFAETANADAAIVAWSLVKDKGGQLLPAEWHLPIVQAAAIPKRGRNPEAADRVVRYLLSPLGQKLLAARGFSPAPTAPRNQSASPGR